MKKLILAFIVGLNTFVYSQFNFNFNDSLIVKVGTDTLNLAWFGGANYAQFSDIDYDFDGDLDLFFFDRSSDNIRMFENQFFNGQRAYKMVQQAHLYFPPEVRYRAALVDYNQDGKKDLFTYAVGGVMVFKNTGNNSIGLQWELASSLLESDYYGDVMNLYVSSSDIPAYIDVDGDFDVDILTFNLAGDLVEYHQNQSRELYGHSDSLVFSLKNACWGKFSEDAITSEITLNATLTPCTTGNVPNPQLGKNEVVDKELTRHSGSTILALDLDNSGVLDLVLGDVAANNLASLINNGTEPNTNSAMGSVDLNFPSNTTPASLSTFPAAYFIDVDFDEVKDLIVTPSAKNISQNVKSIYFYKNLGSNTNPNFSFQTDAFLQNEMIDIGLGSIPILCDENGDGKKDLMVASFYRYKEIMDKESAISYYRNTSSSMVPTYSFVSNDYLNLSQQGYGLRTVPAFGDVDSDGDQDVFYGLENGFLVYRENLAGPNAPFNFDSPINLYSDSDGNIIQAQAYAFPQLFDLNKDGLLDLIIGKRTGELLYYQNTGQANAPSFTLLNDTLGNIDLATDTPDGYAAPHFFRHQDTTYLMLGAFDGKLHFYKGIDEHLAEGQSFELISDQFLNIDVQKHSSCWIEDVDQDGNLNMFVGGDLGGLYHLEHSLTGSLVINGEQAGLLKVFPNPVQDVLNIKVGNAYSGESYFSLINILGQVIFEQKFIKDMQLDVSNLEKGTYIVEVKSGNFKNRTKLIVW